MPAPPPMKYCPDCNAPNPQARTECFACKQSLGEKSAPGAAIGGDERTYSCVNCGEPVPFVALFCPSCGRSVQPPPPSVTPSAAHRTGPAVIGARLPPGWEAEPLPDGTVRLRRTTGGLFLRDVALPVGLFSATDLMVALTVGTHNAGYGIGAILLGIITILLLLATVAAFVWGIASREELQFGPNLLVRRQYLASYEQTWRVEGQANLCITTHKSGSDWSRHGSNTTRILHAEHGAQSRVIDQHTADARQYGVAWRTMSGIASDAMGGHGDDATVIMARYLSAQTGWPILDDQDTGLLLLPLR